MFIVLGVHSLDLPFAVEIYIWTLIDVSPSGALLISCCFRLASPQDVKVSHLGVTLTSVQSCLVTGLLWTSDFTFPNLSYFTYKVQQLHCRLLSVLILVRAQQCKGFFPPLWYWRLSIFT